MKKLLKAFTIFILCAVMCTAGAGCSQNQTMLLSSELLGSRLELRIYGSGNDSILSQVSAVCKQADELFSPTDPNSELNLFNACGGEDMSLSSDFLQLLRVSMYYCELSDGAYDITADRLNALWDFKSAVPALPDDDDLKDALEYVGIQNLTMSAYSALMEEDTKIGFGSLAKGYMLDKIVDCIDESGVTGASLSIDGCMVALGKTDKKNSRVTLPFPFSEANDTLGTVSVADCTAVTLSADSEYFKLGDTLYHGFLDPDTGYPAETDLYSVTVFADTPLRACALAETCMRIGMYRSIELISTLPHVDAVFVTDRYEVRVTSGFTDKYDPDFNRAYTEQLQ